MASRPTPQPGKLVIRGYPEETSEVSIREWFEPFGPIEEVASPPLYTMTGAKSNKGRGYTFVRFVNPADAEKAIAVMNEKVIDGHKLSVIQSLYAKGQGNGQGTTRGGGSARGGRDQFDAERYDRPSAERRGGGGGGGYDRYNYDRRRWRSRSPPDYQYDYGTDYYAGYSSSYDDYYSGRDNREQFRPRPPPRRYADSYEDDYYYQQPRGARRYPPEDPYYSEYERPYEEYDRPSRRPPPPESRERAPPAERRPPPPPVDSYADDRYEMSSRRAPATSEPTTAPSSSTQAVTYPMPASYRL